LLLKLLVQLGTVSVAAWMYNRKSKVFSERKIKYHSQHVSGGKKTPTTIKTWEKGQENIK